MTEFELVKNIAKHIRYKPLTELKVKQFRLSDWESTEDTINSLILSVFSENDIITAPPISRKAFYKYGILDVDIEVKPDLIGTEFQRGIYLLDEMGWIDRDNAMSSEERISFLMGLWEAIQQNKMYLMLYMKAPFVAADEAVEIDISNMDTSTLHGMKIAQRLGRYYQLPAVFDITDAYLTNAPALKVWRNFYL